MSSQQEPVETCLASYEYGFQKDILRNKVAFITGGGSGICFTIAEIFMRHGCDVAIAGRKIDRLRLSSETLSKSTGRQCIPVQMDVRKPQEVIAGIDKCLQHFGKINILVNGAAGNFLCPLESMSFNAFRTVMEIDTFGTYNVSKVVFDKYFKEHGGAIINITATLHYTGKILQAHVGTAKAAIEYLTRHQAIEWGPKGVRVVCVAPGPIGDTEGMRRLNGGRTNEEIASVLPLKRLGTRQEIGEICLFLATDMGSYITGTSVLADGASWMGNSDDSKAVELYKKFFSKM